MTELGGKPSISADDYWALPREDRAVIDAWLNQEGLTGERLVSFELIEGAINAERYVEDGNGWFITDAGDRVRTEHRVYPIRTAPPREAMSR